MPSTTITIPKMVFQTESRRSEQVKLNSVSTHSMGLHVVPKLHLSSEITMLYFAQDPSQRLLDDFFKSIQFCILSDLMWFKNATIHYYIDTGPENLSRSHGTSYIKHRIAISELGRIH